MLPIRRDVSFDCYEDDENNGRGDRDLSSSKRTREQSSDQKLDRSNGDFVKKFIDKTGGVVGDQWRYIIAALSEVV